MDMSKLQDKMRTVPFGMSVFQIKNFNRGQETPERLYRNCLLQLNQKMRVLKECEFRRARYEIDIEEIDEKSKNSDGFEKRRMEIDRNEKVFNLEQEIKLIEDCYIECRTYVDILDQLPEFTREQFEGAEGVYWEKRLLDDAKYEVLSIGTIGKDTAKSLEQIGIMIGKNKKGQIAYTANKMLEDTNELGKPPENI